MNFQQQNHNMNNFEERLQAEVKSREGISNEIMNIRSQIVTCMTMTPNTSTMSSQSQYQQAQTPPQNPNQNAHTNFPNPVYNPNFVPAQVPPFHLQQLLNRLSIQEQKFQLSEQNIQNIAQDFANLKKEVTEIKETVNDDQQYNRRWNGLLHGLDDVPIAPDKPSQEFNESFTEYVIDKLNELFPDLKTPITYNGITYNCIPIFIKLQDLVQKALSKWS